MAETAESPPAASKDTFDEVLLAMDVVDTLRRREQLTMQELSTHDRKEALIARLKKIYAAQGIDVPDRVLREGVQAMEDKRFVYEPPEPSFSVWLAKIYVSRDRWLKPLLIGLGAFIAAGLVLQFAILRPAAERREAARVELSQGLPTEINQLHANIVSATGDAEALRLADTLQQSGLSAARTGNLSDARGARDELVTLQSDIAAIYDVVVVSRPGEPSGVFRIPDDVPGARNYYLIVEAIDPRGQRVEVPITSEENQRSGRVTIWGQRVSEDVFNRVAADKGDDQIIQDAVIGQKRGGQLRPEFSVNAPGGAILEW